MRAEDDRVTIEVLNGARPRRRVDERSRKVELARVIESVKWCRGKGERRRKVAFTALRWLKVAEG